MHIGEGENIDDHVDFNNFSDLDVFTRQYIGTSLQGKNRDDSISVIDEEENNSTNASAELFDSQSKNDSILFRIFRQWSS